MGLQAGVLCLSPYICKVGKREPCVEETRPYGGYIPDVDNNWFSREDCGGIYKNAEQYTMCYLKPVQWLGFQYQGAGYLPLGVQFAKKMYSNGTSRQKRSENNYLQFVQFVQKIVCFCANNRIQVDFEFAAACFGGLICDRQRAFQRTGSKHVTSINYFFTGYSGKVQL